MSDRQQSERRWEEVEVADEERQIKRARLIGPREYKNVWQKMYYERAQEMRKAREEFDERAARKHYATPTTVLGAPRPDFGPPAIVRDGDFIDQRPLLPPARAVTARTVLGAPRPEFEPPKAILAQPAARAVTGQPWPRPDPGTKIKVTTMTPTRAFLNRDRAISSKSVLGAPRPEFGPPDSAIDIKFENGRPSYRPNEVQKDVIKEHLVARGLPTKQVDELKFVSGLDDDAGIPTWLGYHGGGEAVTQGSTVYVNPEKFIDYAGFYSQDPFEEAYHSADFAASGGASFYSPYIAGIVGGGLSGKGVYQGIPSEAFAKGAAKEMYRSYRYRAGDEGK